MYTWGYFFRGHSVVSQHKEREAIWRHIMQENPLAAGALPRTPLGELTALPKPLAGGMWRGLAAPSRKPHHRIGPSGLGLLPSPPMSSLQNKF